MHAVVFIAMLLLLPQTGSSTSETGRRNAAVAEALQLRNRGEGAAALERLQLALKESPDDPVLLTDAGIQANVLHDYPVAAAVLEKALAIEPERADALYALARVRMDTNRPAEAETLLRHYLQLRPNDSSAHYGQGHLLQRLQRNEEADAQFRESIRLQPLQTESYYQLGQMALAEGHDPEAEAMFQKALARMETHGGALTGRGILCYREHRYEEALDWLRRAVIASPDYQPAHYYLGLTLSRTEDNTASKRELDRAKALIDLQQGKSAPVGRANGAPLP